MTLRHSRLLIIGGIAVAFMLLYRVDWPGFWFGGPLKPTILTLAAVLVANYFRVASWPLVAIFALLPFALNTLEFVVGASGAVAGTTPEAQQNQVGIMTLSAVLSPITLIGPVVAAVIGHVVAGKMRPNTSLERTREG